MNQNQGCCKSCGEKIESDGYEEFIHAETGKYACDPDAAKKTNPAAWLKVATPR